MAGYSSSLSLVGDNNGAQSVSGLDGSGGTALTWTLGGVLAKDRYTLSFGSSLTDIAGNQLSSWQTRFGVLPGDADGNTIVDMADYVIWFNYIGGEGIYADFDGNGIVDMADYTTWFNYFGQTV
ncbi:MAG: hypothetical protein ACE15C_18525 [Phycisphaerae bacterium]